MCHPLQQRLQSSICDNWLVFHITVEELWLTLLCGIVNSATLKGFRAWIDCSKSNVTGSQSDLSPDYDSATQNLNFVFFLSHSELNLLVCLGSLSCCITQVCHKLTAGCSPSGFSDRVPNSWFHQLWQVVQVRPKQPQTITLPPPCLTAGMMFLWNPVLVLCQM